MVVCTPGGTVVLAIMMPPALAAWIWWPPIDGNG